MKNIEEGVKQLKENYENSIKTTNIALNQIRFFKKQIAELQKENKKYGDSVDTALGTIKDQNIYIKHLLEKIKERNKIITNLTKRYEN